MSKVTYESMSEEPCLALYVFAPNGIGPPRFYVMEVNIFDAWDAVEDYVVDSNNGIDSYTAYKYEAGEVIEDNLC